MIEATWAATRDGGKLVILALAEFRTWFGSTYGEGENLEVIVRRAEADRTKAQNDAYHACLERWIRAALPEYLARGMEAAKADLKRELLKGCFGVRVYQSRLTGLVETVLVEPHTSDLSRKKFADLFDFTMQAADETGYVMETPDEFLERKGAA